MAQNQPVIPVERGRTNLENIVSRLYNQPVDDQSVSANVADETHTEGDVLYDCNFCNASFARVSNLREHQKKKAFIHILFLLALSSKLENVAKKYERSFHHS